MRRKKLAGQSKESGPKKVDGKALEIVHPDAAGIDVGGSEHWVAIGPERDPEPVRRFGCFTADLREMALWLVDRGVKSVAMQSTGGFWRVSRRQTRVSAPLSYASSSWTGSPVRSSSELAIFTGRPMGLMYSLRQSMPSAL